MNFEFVLRLEYLAQWAISRDDTRNQDFFCLEISCRLHRFVEQHIHNGSLKGCSEIFNRKILTLLLLHSIDFIQHSGLESTKGEVVRAFQFRTRKFEAVWVACFRGALDRRSAGIWKT